MPILERRELGDDVRRGGEHAGDVHELGEPDNLGMMAERQQVGDAERCAGGLEGSRRNAGREVDPDVHHGPLGTAQKVLNGRHTEDIGHLVRVADGRGDAMRQDTAVEFERRDE